MDDAIVQALVVLLRRALDRGWIGEAGDTNPDGLASCLLTADLVIDEEVAAALAILRAEKKENPS